MIKVKTGDQVEWTSSAMGPSTRLHGTVEKRSKLGVLLIRYDSGARCWIHESKVRIIDDRFVWKDGDIKRI